MKFGPHPPNCTAKSQEAPPESIQVVAFQIKKATLPKQPLTKGSQAAILGQ